MDCKRPMLAFSTCLARFGGKLAVRVMCGLSPGLLAKSAYFLKQVTSKQVRQVKQVTPTRTLLDCCWDARRSLTSPSRAFSGESKTLSTMSELRIASGRPIVLIESGPV